MLVVSRLEQSDEAAGFLEIAGFVPDSISISAAGCASVAFDCEDNPSLIVGYNAAMAHVIRGDIASPESWIVVGIQDLQLILPCPVLQPKSGSGLGSPFLKLSRCHFERS